MAIRWDKGLRQEARRIVKNYNAKVRYQMRKGVNLGAVKTTSMRALKKYSSRKELKSVLANLQAFSKRGAEGTAYKTSTGKIYLNWELDTMGSRVRDAIRKGEKEYKTLRSHALTNAGEIYSRRRSALSQKNFDAFEEALENLKSFNAKKATTREKVQALRDIKTINRGETYYNTGRVGNFIEVLEEGGRVTGLEKEASEIIQKLRKLDPDTANAIIEGESYVEAIIEEYDKLKNSATNKLRQEAWENEHELISKLSSNFDMVIQNWTSGPNLKDGGFI